MGYLRNIAITIWRIWFYILMAVPIILMAPILLVSISKRSWYPYFFKLARIWATLILYGMGFFPKVSFAQRPAHGKSYMFVANHTSMADIMLMLYCVKSPFVFVGKAELAKIPVFGFFYKRTCILVDRKNAHSRQAVFKLAKDRLDAGISICIFPEGGVPENESIVLDTFKDGAFRLAIDYQIPIAPLVFFDNKKRFSYTFLSGSLGVMRAKMLPFIPTKGLDQTQRKELREKTHQIIQTQLEQKSRS